MPVLGVGGIFFRASDPDALKAWYREHLGVGAGCAADGAGPPDEWSWHGARAARSSSRRSRPRPTTGRPTSSSCSTCA